MDITPSQQQDAALIAVARWHKQCMAEIHANKPLSQPIFRLFGLAGTGKTTLARKFAESVEGDTIYCAFTGKAAVVMRRAGCHGARTIHSLIYAPKQDSKTGHVRFDLDDDSPAKDADLIVPDECSMVDEVLGRDLMSFGRPILVLGDPMQLPPVKSDRDRANGTGAGFFTEAEPDIMLTEVHRQARDNPILAMATDVREGKRLDFGAYGDSRIIRKKDVTARMVLEHDQVIVGRNDTRTSYNKRIRQILKRESHMPEVEDRLVCLRNNRSTGLFNGGLFEVVEVPRPKASHRIADRIPLIVKSLDLDGAAAQDVETRIECWDGDLKEVHWQDRKGADEFDYGYALTCHKSQGSQWDHVMLFDEAYAFRDDAQRWLYTAITRAAKTITICRG